MEEVKLLLNEIINRLDKIEERLKNIEEKQDKITDSTNNMDNHIQFVENVYDNMSKYKVFKPLSYFINYRS